MDTGEYKGALKGKCAEQEATFRTAILAADKVDGMTAKDSAADADDQIAEYLDKFTSEYEDYMSSSAAKPTALGGDTSGATERQTAHLWVGDLQGMTTRAQRYSGGRGLPHPLRGRARFHVPSPGAAGSIL